MTITEQINAYFAELPEQKRNDMLSLHGLMLKIMPDCRLWFDDGKNDENKTVCNPTVGYGRQILKYADGKTREFFQIGLSANKTGISIYLIGLKDKAALATNFGDSIGKAKVSGYCIRFKKLEDVRTDTLESAVRYGIEETRQL